MHKDCKIVCEGKEMATIKWDESGLKIEFTEEGKKLHKEKGCCCH